MGQILLIGCKEFATLGERMQQAENVVVAEETPVQESSQQEAATLEASETSNSERQEDSSTQRKRNAEEYNWADARRKMQALEDEVKRLREKPSPQEDEFNFNDEDIPTGKDVKRLIKKEAVHIAKEMIRQREAQTVDERINLKFPDYNQIVTAESIEVLKQTEPEIAMSLANMTDPYTQAIAAYKYMKTLNPSKEKPVGVVEKKKAEANLQKPVSVNSASKHSALGSVSMFENGLTPELKKQLWDEMRTAMKQG